MYRMRVFLAIAWALALGGIGYAQDRGWATAIAWSPDGETIAVGSSTGVWLFDNDFIESGYVATPEFEGFPPDSLDWNAAGDMIALSIRDNFDTPLLIVSTESRRVVARIAAWFPISVRWHPEENIVVSVSFFEVSIWDALTGEQLVTIDKLKPPELEVRYFNHLFSVCWMSKDVIAVAGDYDIFIVRVSDQKALMTFGNRGSVAVDCHRNVKMVTTEGDVYDLVIGRRLETQSQFATLNDYTVDYVSVAWSPDGSKIVANGNSGMCRFGVFDGETTEILAELQGSFSRVHDYLRYADSIAWHPDGSRFAVVGQFDIRLWDAKTYTLLHRYEGFEVGHDHLIDPENSLSDEERRMEMYSNLTKCPGS